MAKKDKLTGLTIFRAPVNPPATCAQVIVIPNPPAKTYTGKVIARAKDSDGDIRYLQIETQNTLWRDSKWESVWDVFEVEQ